MTVLRVAMAGAAFWIVASVALAQPYGSTSAPMVAQAGVTGDPSTPPASSESDAQFLKLDKNHDGSLDKTEAKGAVADFNAADADGNGRLDATEYAASQADDASGGDVEYPGGDAD